MHHLTCQIGEVSARCREFLFEESPSVDRETSQPVINLLPFCASLIKIADGWHYFIKEKSEYRDVLTVYAEEGFELTEHSHFQHEEIEVIEGSLTVIVGSNKYTISEGESIEIPSYTPHACISFNGNCLMEVTFIPPITTIMHGVEH